MRSSAPPPANGSGSASSVGISRARPNAWRRRLPIGRRPSMLSSAMPSPFCSPIRRAGALVILQVQTIAAAKRAAALGADLIVAQGTEAGGHGAQRALFPLLPAVVDAVAPIPVLGAGGIADGRGLVAALALGAARASWSGRASMPPRRRSARRRQSAPGRRRRRRDGAHAGVRHRPWPAVAERVHRPRDPQRVHRALARSRGRVARGAADEQRRYAEAAGGRPRDGAGVGRRGTGSRARVRPAAAIIAEILDEAHAVLRMLARQFGGESA